MNADVREIAKAKFELMRLIRAEKARCQLCFGICDKWLGVDHTDGAHLTVAPHDYAQAIQ